jgi:hypothetical protein
MTRADRLYSRPPIRTPIADDPICAAAETHRTSLRSYLPEGLLVTWVLVCAAALGCMVADRVEGKIAARCAADLQRVLQ